MRLVDADALLEKKISLGYNSEMQNGFAYAVSDIVILNAPTIEAEPVIHAHWVTMSDNCGMFYYCSNCGEDLPRHFIKKPSHTDLYGELISIDKTPRCPYCGAKMNKEVEG